MKPARLRPAARRDLIELSHGSAREAGEALAARFFDAAKIALKPMQRMPAIGLPALAESVGLPGLRHWGVNGFAVRWFYLERKDHLDVLRLLGARQDIAAILAAAPPARG